MTTPKSRRFRSVSVGGRLLRLLRDHYAPQSELYACDLTHHHVFVMPVRVHRHDHGRWQSSTAGEPMDRTTVSRDWHKQALQDAGLRDMPLHSLRHTAAASWLLAGQPLSLLESDLDQNRGSILVRHGKNDRRREVGMDAWAWSALEPWLLERTKLPVGPLFCVIVGPTCGHRWSESAARLELHRTATEAGVRRRFAPHQLRHAHAVELLHEGIPLPQIQRQLGHTHLSTTGTYLQGISSEEIISTVHARRAPMMHASAGLAL